VWPALGLFGSIPLALVVVYLIGGVRWYVQLPTYVGGAALIAAFAAALAFGERVWPAAFQREVVSAALLCAFAAVGCVYAGGYLLPLVSDVLFPQDMTGLAVGVGIVVYAAGCVLAAGEREIDDARWLWLGASIAGPVALYAFVLVRG
jgi:hypothetical protein